MPTKYTIGCDPELFVFKNNNPVSAYGLFEGTKSDPSPVDFGSIQVDGTAAEFNILPASTASEFSENIRAVLAQLLTVIQAKDPELSLRVLPTVFFHKDYFKTLGPEELAFGCEPDFDAYTGKQNKFSGTDQPMRTGAGHVHVGWTFGQDLMDQAHFFDCVSAVKQLDSVLFPMSLLWDADSTRRTLYGKIGSFRPKPYGVEYRPLSNAYIADPDLHKFVFSATLKAMELLDDDVPLNQSSYSQKIIEDCKNDAKIEKARLLDYHDYLVEGYNIPSLPRAYL